MLAKIKGSLRSIWLYGILLLTGVILFVFTYNYQTYQVQIAIEKQHLTSVMMAKKSGSKKFTITEAFLNNQIYLPTTAGNHANREDQDKEILLRLFVKADKAKVKLFALEGLKIQSKDKKTKRNVSTEAVAEEVLFQTEKAITIGVLMIDWKLIQHVIVKQAEELNNIQVHIFDHRILVRTSHIHLNLVRLVARANYYLIHPDKNFTKYEGTLQESKFKKYTTEHTLAVDAFHFDNHGAKTLVLPKNSRALSTQLVSAQFVPCNNTRARSFLHKNKVHQSDWQDRAKFSAVMQDVRETFLKQGLNPWLMGGTLLGWYRQCDFIPGDADADVSVQYNKQQASAIRAVKKAYKNKKRAVQLTWEFGKPSKFYQLAVIGFNFKVDIIFMYFRQNATGNYSWISEHLFNEGDIYIHLYPFANFKLCTTNLLDYLYTVPCSEEIQRAILEGDYGKNFMLPVKLEDFGNERPNMFKAGKYSKSEMEKYLRFITEDAPAELTDIETFKNGKYVKPIT